MRGRKPEIPKQFSEERRRALAKMKPSSRYQFIRIWQGLCAGCGKEPLVSARLGLNCLKKQRERMRKKTGAKKRIESLSYSLEKGL